MTYLETLQQRHKARQARLFPVPKKTAKPNIAPHPIRRERDFLFVATDQLCSVSVKTIIEKVGTHYGVTYLEMIADRKFVGLVRARQVAYYLARKLTPHSLPILGKAFRRDHSTILYGANKINKMQEGDPGFVVELMALEELIRCGGAQ